MTLCGTIIEYMIFWIIWFFVIILMAAIFFLGMVIWANIKGGKGEK